MMKKTLPLSISALFLLLCIQTAFAQGEKTWTILSNVKFKNYYDENLGFDISQPVFSQEIKALEKQEIYIKGYIIPVDTDGSYVVLSAFPYSSCFFCGGAGPETVMEIDMEEDKSLLNKRVVLKGKLKLNVSDFYQLIYRLEDAELVSKD